MDMQNPSDSSEQQNVDLSYQAQLLDTIFSQCQNDLAEFMTHRQQIQRGFDFQAFFDPYRETCLAILTKCEDEDLEGSIAKMLEQYPIQASVCAKEINKGDVAFKCVTCEKDACAIQCQECFQHSDHKSHSFKLNKVANGNCDCGDAAVWDEKGFCQKHQKAREVNETIMKNLSQYHTEAGTIVLGNISKQLKKLCVKLQEFAKTHQMLQHSFIEMISIVFSINYIQDALPVFGNFLRDSLNQYFLNDIERQKSHKCCYRTFIDEDDEKNLLKQIKQFINDNPNKFIEFPEDQKQALLNAENFESIRQICKEQTIFCTCTTMDLVVQTNHFIPEHIQERIKSLLTSLMQSVRYKFILAKSLLSNYPVVGLNYNTLSSIGELTFQFLALDEIAFELMHEKTFQQNLLATVNLAFDIYVNSSYKAGFIPLKQILKDLSFLTRKKTLTYLLKEISFTTDLIKIVGKLTFADFKEVSNEVQMEEFDKGPYKLLGKIYNLLEDHLQSMDYNDANQNKEFLSDYVGLIKNFNIPMMENHDVGFSILPVHLIFSFYLNKLILYNYFELKKQNPEEAKKDDVYYKIFTKFLEIPEGEDKDTFVQKVLIGALKPALRAWIYVHDIRHKKWTCFPYCTDQIYTRFYQDNHLNLFPFINLFQMTIAISPRKQEIINEILSFYNNDPWIKTFNKQILNSTFELDQFSNFGQTFDFKKLRSMISSKLKFFINLCISEYSLWSQSISSMYFYTEKRIQNDFILDISRNELKRMLIHCFIANGGISNYQQLRSGFAFYYSKTTIFQETLLEIAEIQQNIDNTKDNVQLKLKEQYLEQFEPYYYLDMSEYSKALEHIHNFKGFKNKLILGETSGIHQYQTSINNMIARSLITSNFLNILKNYIKHWLLNTEKNEPAVDEQICHSSLKLIQLILQNSDDKTQILEVFDEEFQQLLINSTTQNDDLNTSCLYLIKLMKGDVSTNVEESKQEQINTSKQPLIKVDRRKQILENFKQKRQNFIQNRVQSQQVNNIEELKNETELTVENCDLCMEALDIKNYNENPFGKLALIQQSSLLYHSMVQTLNQETKSLYYSDFNHNEAPSQIYDQFNYVSNEDYFLQGYNVSGIITTCGHSMHFKCLKKYLQSLDEINRTFEEFGHVSFRCPLCSQFAFLMIPQNNFNQEPSDFVLKLNDNIIQVLGKSQQEDHQKLVQIEYLISIRNLIDHKIQLINIKGLMDFLKPLRIQVGLDDYSTLMKILKIKVDKQFTDQEKLQLPTIIEVDEIFSDEKLFEKNLGSLALKLVFSDYLESQNPDNSLDQALIIIKKVYQYLKIQVLLKALIIKLVKKELNIDFLQDLSLEKLKEVAISNEELVVQAQLPFLRQMSALKLLVIQPESQNLIKEEFIKNYKSCQDDTSELKLLTSFLNLDCCFTFNTSEQSSQVQSRIIQDLLKISQESQLINYLPTLHDHVNKEKITMPDQLKLLTPYFTFNLIDLPKSYEDFIYQNNLLMCKNCSMYPKQAGLCLICGEIQCCDGTCCLDSSYLPDIFIDETEPLYHARKHHGGAGLFVEIHYGVINLVFNQATTQWGSVYRNKLGNSIYQFYDLAEMYELKQEIIDKVREKYMNFEIIHETHKI